MNSHFFHITTKAVFDHVAGLSELKTVNSEILKGRDAAAEAGVNGLIPLSPLFSKLSKDRIPEDREAKAIFGCFEDPRRAWRGRHPLADDVVKKLLEYQLCKEPNAGDFCLLQCFISEADQHHVIVRDYSPMRKANGAAVLENSERRIEAFGEVRQSAKPLAEYRYGYNFAMPEVLCLQPIDRRQIKLVEIIPRQKLIDAVSELEKLEADRI